MVRRRVGKSALLSSAVIVVAAAAIIAPAPVRAAGTTLTYPGSAPCDTTLQACIDGAASGDTIEMVTDTPIDESPTISKSLILTAGPGHHPAIGGGPSRDALTVNDGGGSAVDVTVTHIAFMNAEVDVSFDIWTGNKFTLADSSVRHMENSNNADGVSINDGVGGAEVQLIHNTIQTTGQPVDLSTQMPGSTDTAAFKVVGNRLTRRSPRTPITGSRSTCVAPGTSRSMQTAT